MLLLPLSALLTLSAVPVEPTSPSDRAVSVVTQKAQMPNRYCLRLRVESRTPGAKPPLEKESSSTRHLWRDGDKFRADHLDASYTPPRPGHDRRTRHVSCENCEQQGYGVVTTIVAEPGLTNHAVEFHRLGTRSFDYGCTHFDWRYLGLGNCQQCVYPHLQIGANFPLHFKGPDAVVQTMNRGDTPCLVAIKTGKGTKVSVWLSERDGYNPIYFEEYFDLPEGKERRTTEITWQSTAGGHLYPKTVKYNGIIGFDGGRYPTEEVITVMHADFDSPIDPAVFTVAGLGLNENQPIGLPGLVPEDYPTWRNGKVDESYTLKKRTAEQAKGQPATTGQTPVPAYPGRGNTALILSIVAGVLAIAAATVAVVLRRRRAVT